MRLRVLIVTAFCCSGVIAILSSCVRSLKPSEATNRVPAHIAVASSTHTNIQAASQFREWIKESWSTNSFDSGARFAREKDLRTQALALEKLFSNRQLMSEIELRGFRRMLEEQARAKSDDPYVVAASIRTLAGLLDYLEVKGLVSKADVAPDEELFVSYLGNATLDLQVRGAAIRAVGELRIESGKKYVEELLLDSANINTPEIARNGCLALVKLSNDEAFTPIRGVFERTSDSTVFGTAAFCLGEIRNVDAMSVLEKNISRFPDSESCDAALVKMDAVIPEPLRLNRNGPTLTLLRR